MDFLAFLTQVTLTAEPDGDLPVAGFSQDFGSAAGDRASYRGVLLDPGFRVPAPGGQTW